MRLCPWIEEVWSNCISNALKYGGDAEAGIAPRVELGVCNVEDQTGYRFFVRDNSPGLTLGLSIVQRIVEKFGGQVGVDSAGAGRGCPFWFVLPASA